ncbi:MAG: hypothetical protein U0Q21_02550 [Dermatophilaceae bacterium]
MTPPFRLTPGDSAPRQQSRTTCGSACLTIARMLVDPLFAHWILTGEGPAAGQAQGSDMAGRFAAYERIVHRRTNSVRAGGGRINLPWPQALGTPPWGAKAELEFGAARRGTRYDVEVLRHHRRSGLDAHYSRLLELVADGEPALLYVGDRLIPRHVCLILPDRGDGNLEVYEPSAGVVEQLDRAEFVASAVGLGGWNRAWISVQPTGLRQARSRSLAPSFAEASPA